MYFTFSTYATLIAVASLVAGLALLAGTDRSTWAERRNSVGCVLVALALLLHGILVSGAALLSPRNLLHGDICVADFMWTRTVQIYIDTPHVIPGRDGFPAPCKATEIGVLFRDTPSHDFTRAVMGGKVYEATVEYTLWDRKARNVTVTGVLSDDWHSWLPAKWQWQERSSVFWFFIEMFAAVLMLAFASYIWVAARRTPKYRGTPEEIFSEL